MADRKITDEPMDGTPQGIANRLRYRLSERYPLGTVEVEPTADGGQIKVTLHSKSGEKHENSFDTEKLQRAQDPLNEVLTHLVEPRKLIPGTSDTVELGGKLIETADRETDEDGNEQERVVVTGDAPLTGADSAPDGDVTAEVTNPGSDGGKTGTEGAKTDDGTDEADKNEPRTRTRAAAKTKADDKSAKDTKKK